MSMMNRSVYRRFDCPPIDPSYNKLSHVDDVVDGKLVKRSVVKRVSVVDSFGDLQSSEFSVQNYIALGITEQLKLGFFANHDVDSISSQVDNALSKFDNANSIPND